MVGTAVSPNPTNPVPTNGTAQLVWSWTPNPYLRFESATQGRGVIHQQSYGYNEEGQDHGDKSRFRLEDTIISTGSVSNEGICEGAPAIGANEDTDTGGNIDKAGYSSTHAVRRKLKDRSVGRIDTDIKSQFGRKRQEGVERCWINEHGPRS
jgi:hypothetical protein